MGNPGVGRSGLGWKEVTHTNVADKRGTRRLIDHNYYMAALCIIYLVSTSEESTVVQSTCKERELCRHGTLSLACGYKHNAEEISNKVRKTLCAVLIVIFFFL